MHSARKGTNYYFGAKVHIGVDSGTGYIHSHTTTSANVHDIVEACKLIRKDDHTFKADSGYIGIQKREEILNNEHLKNIEYRIVEKPSSYKRKNNNSPIANRIHKTIEKGLISARQKVEAQSRTDASLLAIGSLSVGDVPTERSEGEYPFHIIKNIFKFKKCPYKGLKKNDNKISILIALTNLYMVSSAGRTFVTS